MSTHGIPPSFSTTDRSVVNGTTYYYVVKAHSAGGDSPASAEVSARPQAPPVTTPPSAPTLSGTPRDSEAYLSWSYVYHAKSYRIYRSTTAGTFSSTPYATTSSTSHSDLNVTNGQTYYYVARAVNDYGESPLSNEVSVTPQLAEEPSRLVARAGDAQVALSWREARDALGYKVYRGTAAAGYSSTPVATVSGTTHTDMGLLNGTTYYYYVRAVNAGGQSGASNQVGATPLELAPAPSGLRATPGNAQVRLDWNAVAGATYGLRRALDPDGPYITLISGLTSTSCLNTGLTNGTPYYYRVFAQNANGGTKGDSLAVRAIPNIMPTLPPPEQPDPNLVRPLADVLENMEGTPWSAVRLAAGDQASATLGPKYRNIPGALPFHANFEGTFIPASNDTRLAIFSDDGCDVYIDGTLVHNHLNRGQHLPALNQSLHRIETELVAGQSYNIRVEYSNTIYKGTTDADGATLFAYTYSDNQDRPFVEWQAGQPITSAGIRWPSEDLKIRGGTVGHPSAFLATDWDVMQRIADGIVTVQDVSDPCSYTWSASAGSFSSPNGATVAWRAPTVSVPTDVTLTLVVDDQNAGNVAPGETGTRNDAARGYNDDPQRFTVTIRVEP